MEATIGFKSVSGLKYKQSPFGRFRTTTGSLEVLGI